MSASGELIVRDKPTYYRLARTYQFGNRFMTWDGIDEWRKSGYSGPIRFRSKIPGSKLFTTGTPHEGRDVEAAHAAAIASGESPENVVFCEPAPEEFLVFQGEICEGPLGEVCLTWSTEKGITNREAMTRPTGRHSGLAARIIMRHFLDDSDYEWLLGLLGTWPEHAVEFSAYAVPVGLFRTRMVVWEVRKF